MIFDIAIDPGLTSGVFMRDTTTGATTGYEMDFAQLAEYMDSYWGEIRTIIVERYTITPETAKKSRQNGALEVIGMMRYFSLASAEGPLILQSPADAKRFSTDDRLKAVGWWIPGQGHTMDAARHMLLHCVKSGIITVTLEPVDA